MVVDKQIKQFRYKNLFAFSSLQFIGNIEEYFVKHTEKLVIHIVMPRTKNRNNIVRLYKNGLLIEERNLWSTQNIFLYYLSWYLQHWYILLHYFNRDEKFFVMSYMPVSFFLGSIQKFFRDISYVFFIGDYCPAKTLPIVIFERIKKYYHDHVPYVCYLSDMINEIMNGKVINTKTHKTVMWGVNPKHIKRKLVLSRFNLLFVGLIKDSQGLEFFYEFLKNHPKYFINILGVCNDKLYLTHKKIINKYKIQKQVYFPNRFFSDAEVEKISQKCNAGVALYDIGKGNMTYYTEPGKVKYYAELGLPIIMSNTSSITSYITKFKAGEIIERDTGSLENTLEIIRRNYEKYSIGLKKFNKYFYYNDYYEKKFEFLENFK